MAGGTPESMTTSTKGFIQIYTGNGKGKTTAALGLALRAAGHKRRSYFGQFMKGQEYGELRAVERLAPLIVIERFGRSGFVHAKEGDPDSRDVEKAQAGLKACLQAMLSGEFHLIVLDEIMVALHFRLVTLVEVAAFLDRKPDEVEVVMTGRYAPDELIERADLVTEMREIKHYYHRGVAARKGIEH